MDVWGFEHIHPWMEARRTMPVGPLFCVLDGRTRQYVDAPYEYVELSGVSHWIPEEAPEELAEAILARVASGATA